MKSIFRKTFVVSLCTFVAFSFASAQNRIATPHEDLVKTQSSKKFLKRKVAIGRFSNETQYGKGLFYDRDNDPMAKQAYDILSGKLAASDKFILLERGDMDKIKEEMNLNEGAKSIGADYLIIGSITEFGRKTTGSEGVFTSQKNQVVEAGVSIRIVDIANGHVIYSQEGKGKAETTTKTTLGFGGKAGYDATLSDKAIASAIDQLVENIINSCTDKPWRSYIINADEDGIIISGGTSQGITTGDCFAVMKKGKRVKNPQTGLFIELPGKSVASIEVIETGGDTPDTEYSIVKVISGDFDKGNLEDYYIQQIK